MFAKPVEKGQVKRGEMVYDPKLHITSFYNEDDLIKLYDEGHTIGKLRRPVEIGGNVAGQMVVRNDANWRGLRDTDVVYPYREGYFQRVYTSPHFIVKRTTVDGVTTERAIATAEKISDANIYKARLEGEDEAAEFFVRRDIKNPREQANLEMDTFMSSGMSNQHMSGDKLEDATAAVMGTENTNVLCPVDAIISPALSGYLAIPCSCGNRCP